MSVCPCSKNERVTRLSAPAFPPLSARFSSHGVPLPHTLTCAQRLTSHPWLAPTMACRLVNVNLLDVMRRWPLPRSWLAENRLKSAQRCTPVHPRSARLSARYMASRPRAAVPCNSMEVSVASASDRSVRFPAVQAFGVRVQPPLLVRLNDRNYIRSVADTIGFIRAMGYPKQERVGYCFLAVAGYDLVCHLCPLSIWQSLKAKNQAKLEPIKGLDAAVDGSLVSTAVSDNKFPDQKFEATCTCQTESMAHIREHQLAQHEMNTYTLT